MPLITDVKVAVYPSEWCLWPMYTVYAGQRLREYFAINLGPIRISWRVA